MSSSSPDRGHGYRKSRRRIARRSQLESFSHIQEPEARRAKEATQDLEFWIGRFPEFTEIGRQAIKALRREARRTPKSDRDKVLAVFERAETALHLDEIADDAKLPEKDVKLIIIEFLRIGLIERLSPGSQRNSGRSGTNWLYCLPGRPHFTPFRKSQNI